ncbi:hypothetical protein PPACK8108_LOCUS3147, partial [Phakopsora pachyrhizi]
YSDDYYNPNAYDSDLYGPYYRVEDDYYGAYGDLLQYEEQLRLAADLDESERLRRWRDRLEFEELAESERTRRYELMAEEERLRLGLIGSSWWARRYGHRYSPTSVHGIGGGWKNHYGNRLRRWGSSRLPLSSTLASRFEKIWYHPSSASGRRRLSNVGVGSNLDRLTRELVRLDEELRVVREEARIRELKIEQERRRIEEEIMIERRRAESIYRIQKVQQEQAEQEIINRNRLEQDLYRDELRRYETDRARVEIERARLENQIARTEAASNLQSQEEELRLRRELDRLGSGMLYNTY